MISRSLFVFCIGSIIFLGGYVFNKTPAKMLPNTPGLNISQCYPDNQEMPGIRINTKKGIHYDPSSPL